MQNITGLILILIAGLLNPVQTGVNSTLRNYLRTPILSSTVSFLVGLTSLMIMTLLTCSTLFPSGETVSGMPWWAWLGGLAGAIGLTGNILLFPKLGGVLTALMPMLGQILMSMLIDTFGWFDTEPIPMATGRIAGLSLVIGGLIMYMSGKRSTDTNFRNKSIILWSLAGIASGLTFAIQPVMNGRLAMALGSSIHSAFISFSISTIILIMILLSTSEERRNIPRVFTAKRPWWTWTGGLLGAYYVSVFALVTNWVGVGLATLTSILGMIIFSTVIDRKGFFGRTPQKIRPIQYAGLLLLFLGVVCIKIL